MVEVTVATPAGALSMLTSAVIPEGFAHGFTLRRADANDAAGRGFNLARGRGDADGTVDDNRRLLQAALGVQHLHLGTQVHGRAVARVEAGYDPATTAAQDVDGLVSRAEGVGLVALAADCVPVLFADPVTGAFAAVHAGWRGTVAGVASAALARLETDFGARPENVRIALGPAIGVCCFEVGAEVTEAVTAIRPDAVQLGLIQRRPGGKDHVDLRVTNQLMLEALGVPSAHIDCETACTRCDPRRRFYSFRREGRTGAHAGAIARSRFTTL